MPRKPDERISQAKEMYLKGMKLVEIASQLNLPEGTVRRWKSTHEWESERSDKKSERSKRRGGQPGNKNAVGHGGTGPPGNKNAEKYGFFSKYLPPETQEIFTAIEQADPLDLLWHQIQIAYAAIIRAQKIMYVEDINDSTTTQVQQKNGDKQGNFLKAQARAQGELRSLIKQYDDMLHKNWKLASEEQKARIAHIKAQTARLTGTESKEELEKLDKVLAEIKGVI